MLPARATRVYNSTTMLQFYAYRIAVRNEFSPILHAKKLFQQYSVDAYCRVEGNNLDYLRHNQATLRADKYTGLMDFVNTRADERGLQPGRVVILPSSFSGSPRAMTQNYQNTMFLSNLPATLNDNNLYLKIYVTYYQFYFVYFNSTDDGF